MSKTRWIVASALALTGLLGAGVANAGRGADVQWSVTVGAPLFVVPAPVRVMREPVYVQPYPAYRVADPYYRPHGGYHGHHGHHGQYREATRWDRDGDGIPNRHDRVYNPRWDVDGDGVPNRYDRDRNGNGRPDWRDHGGYGHGRR